MKHARRAVILTNLVLLGGVAWVGLLAFRGAPPPADLPGAFDPASWALGGAGRGPRDLAVIGAQLDPPPPPPPAPAPEREAPPQPAWRLLLATFDAEQPDRSTSIVADPTGAQLLLRVGEPTDGVTLAAVEVVDSDAGRETIARMCGPGEQTWSLTLRREP